MKFFALCAFLLIALAAVLAADREDPGYWMHADLSEGSNVVNFLPVPAGVEALDYRTVNVYEDQ